MLHAAPRAANAWLYKFKYALPENARKAHPGYPRVGALRLLGCINLMDVLMDAARDATAKDKTTISGGAGRQAGSKNRALCPASP